FRWGRSPYGRFPAAPRKRATAAHGRRHSPGFRRGRGGGGGRLRLGRLRLRRAALARADYARGARRVEEPGEFGSPPRRSTFSVGTALVRSVPHGHAATFAPQHLSTQRCTTGGLQQV